MSDLTLSLTTSQLPAYLFISSKNWRHGKVAHVLVKKSVKLLWKDDPCHVKKQFLTSEELDILLSKNCSINYLLLILCRKGVKPMTFWTQLFSDPLPLSFWKIAQKCYASNKSFSGEYETTTENDYRSQNYELLSTNSLNYYTREDVQYMFIVVSITTTTFWGKGTVENDYGNDDKDLK